MSPTWKKYIEYLSVSQVKCHQRNPFRWVLEKIIKLPTCSSPALVTGSSVHTALEHALTHGTMPKCEIDSPEMKCTKAMMDYWTEENRILGDIGLEIEHEFLYNYREDAPPFFGYIDYIIHGYKGGCPLIGDHKTSKSRKYFLKEEELKDDLQLVVYAKYLLDKYEARGTLCKFVYLEHSQYNYKNKKKILTVVRDKVHKKYIDDRFKEIEKYVRDYMLSTIEEYHSGGFINVPRNKCNSCVDAFGPNSCEFSRICNGNVDVQGYKDAYNNLAEEGYQVTSKELQEEFRRLTYISKSDIIDTKEQEEEVIMQDSTSKIVQLSSLVSRARDKYKDMNNIWDMRQAMTKVIMSYMSDTYTPEDVEIHLPFHFKGGTDGILNVDPDYMPVITQLREKGFKFKIEEGIR